MAVTRDHPWRAETRRDEREIKGWMEYTIQQSEYSLDEAGPLGFEQGYRLPHADDRIDLKDAHNLWPGRVGGPEIDDSASWSRISAMLRSKDSQVYQEVGVRLEAVLGEMQAGGRLKKGAEIWVEGVAGKYIVETVGGQRCGGCSSLRVVVRYIGQYGAGALRSVTVPK